MKCGCMYDDGYLPACPARSATSRCMAYPVVEGGATGPITGVIASESSRVCYKIGHMGGKSGKTKGGKTKGGSAAEDYYYDGGYYGGKSGKTKGRKLDAHEGWLGHEGSPDPDYYYHG